MFCTRTTLLAALALWTAAAVQAQQAEPRPEALTLPRVIALVRESNPHVIAARLRAEAADADILTARVPFPSNPVFEAELGNRVSPGGEDLDRHFVLSQAFYTGPVRGRRVRTAEAAREVAGHLARNELRLAEAAAARLFYRVVAARELVELTREVESLTQRLIEAAERRFQAGEDTALDFNTARIQRSQASRQRLEAELLLKESKALLAVVLGLDAAQRFTVEGALDPPATPPPGDLSAQTGQRPDIVAASERIREKDEAISWRRAERWPELEANVFYAEEDGTDIIRGGGLGVEIPIADRKKGRIARARAEALEAEALHRATTLEAAREVQRARAALETAEEILALYDEEFLEAARENVSLMELAFREGKVAIAEVLVLRQVLVVSHKEYLDARLQRVTATIDLLATAGLPLMEASHAN